MLCLLTGAAFSRGIHLLKNDRTIELFLAIPLIGLFIIAVGAAIVGNGPIWFGLTPYAAVKRIYGTSLFLEAMKVGEYLKTHSEPNASIAVLGSEPEIYFYAHRRSVTGYIYMYPLMEEQSYAARMQQQMIQEIEQAHPKFVVYVDDRFSWLPHPRSEHGIVDWWPGYRSGSLEFIKNIPYREGESDDVGNEGALVESSVSEGEVCELLLFKNQRDQLDGNKSSP